MEEKKTNNKRQRIQMKLFPDMPPEDIDKTARLEAEERSKSKYQRWKEENNYRKADKGINCAKCENIIKDTGHNNVFYKCRLLGTSHSIATDIRLSCVCDLWKERNE